jgi:DNA-directed RNA polymerase subunit E'/Rpb7
MEQVVIFEEKVYITPKSMNLVAKEGLDSILLKQLRKKLENKCSQHGFVIPNSLEILSRSMGLIESGHYTGNIVFHVQSQGRVFNPVNGTRIVGTILKKNKMGLYIIYKDAVRVLIPRDRHLHEQDIMEEFESLEIGDSIEVEIRKSRFQIHDTFILSVGAYLRKAEEPDTELPLPKPIENIGEVLSEA